MRIASRMSFFATSIRSVVSSNVVLAAVEGGAALLILVAARRAQPRVSEEAGRATWRRRR